MAAARRNRLSEHDVLEDLRLNGNVAEIRDVLLAVLERNGHIMSCDAKVNNQGTGYDGCDRGDNHAVQEPGATTKFAQLLVEGKRTNETFEEWNRETGTKKLPERVAATKKTSRGSASPRKRRASKKR